ncbi:hypothetical protein MMC06_003703 [Schaereria dolodes]|nr:hypothetical protein [Schaereria dolodes]
MAFKTSQALVAIKVAPVSNDGQNSAIKAEHEADGGSTPDIAPPSGNGDGTIQPAALSIPDERNARIAWLSRNARKIVREYAQQCKQDSRAHLRQPLTAEQMAEIESLLDVFSNLEDMTPELQDKIRLRIALEIIRNDVPKYATYVFPQHLAQKAKAIHEMYEAEKWGAGFEHELYDGDEVVVAEVNDTEVNDTDVAISITSRATKKQIVSPELHLLRRPTANHTIFGINGIMRGILINPYGKMKSYKFDDRYARKNHKVFGHNGIEIGQWWPMQMAALRDGAHGAKMKGIAGSDNLGATSIVVSGKKSQKKIKTFHFSLHLPIKLLTPDSFPPQGGYQGMDFDFGSRLLYSGSNSHTNTNPTTPTVSKDTKSLQRSLQLGRLVRVIRSSAGEGNLAPLVGYRYDGLFLITDEEQRTNTKGGAYLRFRFERVEHQDPVDASRPTYAEKKLYERVRDGY